MTKAADVSRALSRRTVIDAIILNGPISHTALAKETGLPRQAIPGIVQHLQEHGWVRHAAPAPGRIGRATVTYELDPHCAHVAAVDLGGTKLGAAIADLTGRLVAEDVEPTDPRGGPFVVGQIAALCHRLADEKGIARSRLRFAAVGVPGSPDHRSGQVLLAPNIAGFDGMDVAGALASALGADVVLENDVNLGAVGEHWLGAGRGIDDMAFVALGTGTGCGLIADGRLLRGFNNAAGELAFLPFGADPFDPASLAMGAFERAAGSFGMAGLYARHSGEAISVPALFERAAAQDAHAQMTLDETARTLARGIAAIAAITNPEKVILGGSIGLRPEIIARVRTALPLCFPYPVAIEPGLLGGKASMIGAAAIGLSHLFERAFGARQPGRSALLPTVRRTASAANAR